MNQGKKTVVPFERPAAYWAVRARRHYHPEQLPDAARFMRKALEKSGDTGLALELAQIYSAMGCYTAAERCLLRAALRQGLTGGLCYLIACCALNRGQEELAEQALDASLRLDPEGLYADAAQDLLETYPWREEPWRPHAARSETLCAWSRDAEARGDGAEALRLARRAWQRARTPDAALQLGRLLPPPAGMPYLAWAARRTPDSPAAWLALALACHGAKKEARAQRCLRRAEDLCRGITPLEDFCQAAWAIGQTAQALGLVEKRLAETPVSADLLRLKYLCLKRLGRQDKADRTLEALLEIDGDDPFALWCRRFPRSARPLEEKRLVLSALGRLVYAVPARRSQGRLNRALHLMVMLLDGMVPLETVYRELPPLWRRLSPSQKRRLDLRQEPHIVLAVAAYLGIAAGREAEARALLLSAPGKKRLRRAVRRFIRWRNEA